MAPPVRKNEARIRARRGIALQILRPGLGIGGRVEELGSSRTRSSLAAQLSWPVRTMRRIFGVAVSSMAMSRRSCRSQLAARSGHSIRRTPSPSASSRPSSSKLGRLQPIEVAMGDDEPGRLVTLHQREGRARHLAFAAEPVNESPGQCRLAGAERPRERDHVAAASAARRDGCEDVEPDRSTSSRLQLALILPGLTCSAARRGASPSFRAAGSCLSGSSTLTRVPFPGPRSDRPCPHAARRGS